MPNPALIDYLADKEWYDNSTLDTIDRCIRKGYWKKLFQLPAPNDSTPAPLPGVADKMGVAANFGSAIHSALDKYYSPILYHSQTLQQRKIAAWRAFERKHRELISDPDLIDDKYSVFRGLDLLDMYFDCYEIEDQLFIPHETEIALVIPIEYRPTDGFFFTKFYYVMRLDAVWRRLRFNDLWITEHKTATSPEMKLVELAIGRQTRGYYWGLTQFPADWPIEGVLANVITTRAAESDHAKLFFREFIHLTTADAEIFRLQTIYKVERWRRVREIAASQPTFPLQLAAFDQTTSECTRYGKCSYYDLCLHGPQAVDLTKYQPNTWNPLNAEKMED